MSLSASHVVTVPINTPVHITWSRHHVIGHRSSSTGSLSSASAPPHHDDVIVTSHGDVERRLKDVNNENVRRQSTTTTSGSGFESSMEHRLQPAGSSASFDLSINSSSQTADSFKRAISGGRVLSADGFPVAMTTNTPAVPAHCSVTQHSGVPRIELDTQYVINDAMMTSSSVHTGSRSQIDASSAVTPGIFGLSNDFVVSSAFRRQVALQLGRPVTRSGVIASGRPPAYNPDYLGVNHRPSWGSTSSVTWYDRKTRAPSWFDGKSHSLDSNRSTESSVDKLNASNASINSIVNPLPAETKRTIFSATHNSNTYNNTEQQRDDEDDDVFFNEDNSNNNNNNNNETAPACSSVDDKMAANRKSYSTGNSPRLALHRLFRFSVCDAEVAKSVSLSVGGADSPVSDKRLYPVLPDQSMTSRAASKSLPVRPSRISVCPVSGDVLVIDTDQSLIQFYTSGGRLESCTEIPEITGGCFLHQSDHRRVAVCGREPRGVVELYYRAGSILIHEDRVAHIGTTINVVTYAQGFIAVQSDRLMLYQVEPYVLQHQKTLTEPRRKSSSSWSLLGRVRRSNRSFHDILDCSPTQSGDIVVLERVRILVLDPEGRLLRATTSDSFPVQLTSTGRDVTGSLAVDFRSGAIVCDPASRRLLLFDVGAQKCRLRRTLMEMAAGDDVIARERPTGVAVDSTHNRLLVAVRVGEDKAEIRVFQL